jgi:succinoglycan biosynthesis protein ExoV
MKYAYFKSSIGNFGDDLNPWLWSRLFAEHGDNSDINFLGIGSILFNENPIITSIKDSKKIVFGTGVRPSKNYKNLQTDDAWDIRFFRGPLSAMTMNNKYPYITDAAYAFRQLDNISEYLDCEKKYEVSIMPHFRSVGYFDWEKICKELGLHYISPFSEDGVDFTLREISASKKLITEAMHGAILADIIRVPWHRYVLCTPFTEGAKVSEFKWMDWMYSMEMGYPDASYIPFYKKNFFDKVLFKLSGGNMSSESIIKGPIEKETIKILSQIDTYSLSEDRMIQQVDERIANEVHLLRKQLKMGLL